MFTTFKQRLLLGVYIFLIISIPIGAYLASKTQIFKSKASENTTTKVAPKPTLSPARQLLDSSESEARSNPTPSPNPDVASTTIATSFGPTLSLKVSLEGRPEGNQTTKLFVGIAEGELSSNPKFLLSFTVDLPADGTYTNLSLAGLEIGTQYSALLKGSSQIASSATFVTSPTVSYLNSNLAISLTTGDLNDDNTINSADYSIVQSSLGTTSASSNWNENADFNKDGVINIFDISLISKNLGKTGASGAWTSPIPLVSTPSAQLSPSIGGIGQSETGYWIWVPK